MRQRAELPDARQSGISHVEEFRVQHKLEAHTAFHAWDSPSCSMARCGHFSQDLLIGLILPVSF